MAAADSGEGGRATAAAAATLDGLAAAAAADWDDDDDGWIGIVAAALEQLTANWSALHISVHSDRPLSLYNT